MNQTQTDELVAALKAAEECLSHTLNSRGYVSGTCTDEWSPEVRLEVTTLVKVRAALAKAGALVSLTVTHGMVEDFCRAFYTDFGTNEDRDDKRYSKIAKALEAALAGGAK